MRLSVPVPLLIDYLDLLCHEKHFIPIFHILAYLFSSYLGVLELQQLVGVNWLRLLHHLLLLVILNLLMRNVFECPRQIFNKLFSLINLSLIILRILRMD